MHTTSSPSPSPRRPSAPRKRSSSNDNVASILSIGRKRSIDMRAQAGTQTSKSGLTSPRRTSDIDEENESASPSRTETIPITKADAKGNKGYATNGQDDEVRNRRGGTHATSGSDNGRDAPEEQAEESRDSQQQQQKKTWWQNLNEKYGSKELENKGSVARDHLALERTFLAWLRTSLGFASIGIAVTQLFRLNTGAQTTTSDNDAYSRLRSLGKPLGATFLAISIVVLLVGSHRYFHSQYWIIRGKFPASRGSIILIGGIAFALMVVSLVLVLVAGSTILGG